MINIDRLKRAREEAGLSQTALARRAGVSQQAIGEIERGAVRSSKSIYKIAAALNVSPSVLDPDIPVTIEGVRLVQIVGYVGAGAEVLTIDDHEKGGGLEEVPAPPGATSASIVALRVRGTSMLPVYKNGDTIFYDKKEDSDFSSLIGRDCIVHLEDGRTFLKELRRSNGDLYLYSHNADPIINPQIVWAARVRWVEKA